MKTANPVFRIAGIMLLLLAAMPAGQTAPSTSPVELIGSVSRQNSGNSERSTFLPLHSALAGRTNSAILIPDRYAAVTPRTNGLVGWWKLDETAGTVAADSSGNGHNGTLLNGPTWTAGQMRGALSFDGTNDQVTCADSPALRISGDLTIAFWIKKNAEAKQISLVVGKGNAQVRNYVIWEEAGEDSRLLFQQHDSGGAGLNLWTTSKLAVGTWYHFATVVQGNSVSLYVNGKLDGSKKRSSAGTATTDPLAFGYGGWNEHFPGVLDDVRLYNRALSVDEIAGLYSEAFPDRRRARRHLEQPARSQLAAHSPP